MSGAILSEVYGAFLIMMASQGIVSIPDWLLAQYRDPRNRFKKGMDRLRFCAPALVSKLGSARALHHQQMSAQHPRASEGHHSSKANPLGQNMMSI